MRFSGRSIRIIKELTELHRARAKSRRSKKLKIELMSLTDTWLMNRSVRASMKTSLSRQDTGSIHFRTPEALQRSAGETHNKRSPNLLDDLRLALEKTRQSISERKSLRTSSRTSAVS